MVQSHRCPATVSGTKSVIATEVERLGKAQRVDWCREPGDLPDFLLGAFRGEGYRSVVMVLDLNLARLGFFSVYC